MFTLALEVTTDRTLFGLYFEQSIPELNITVLIISHLLIVSLVTVLKRLYVNDK